MNASTQLKVHLLTVLMGKYSDHKSSNSTPSQPEIIGYQHFETPSTTDHNLLSNIGEKATPAIENTIVALSSSDVKMSPINTDLPPRHSAPNPILDKAFRLKTNPCISLTWSDETRPDPAIFTYLIDSATAEVYTANKQKVDLLPQKAPTELMTTLHRYLSKELVTLMQFHQVLDPISKCEIGIVTVPTQVKLNQPVK